MSRTSVLMAKLCEAKDEDDLASILAQMTSDDLDHLRFLPSFRKYVQENARQLAILLKDDSKFRNCVTELLSELDAVSKRFNVCVRVLHDLAKDLHGKPFGTQIYTVFSAAFLKHVTETHEYRNTFDILKLLGVGDMRKKLETFCANLEGGKA